MNKLNIYIVEDENILAALLKYMLQSMGHHVCGIAASYNDAVRDLKHLQPDVIITDIMLKGTETGVDVARHVKENVNVPFIFLSSVTDEEIMTDALSTEPVAYLKKPANRDLLANALWMFTAINTN